jgi:urease accessory protein
MRALRDGFSKTRKARKEGSRAARSGPRLVRDSGEAMQHAHSVRPAGAWSGEPADTVVLDYDDRYRRRIAMTGVRGLTFLLDLPEAVMLRAGDGLALEDGRIVEVVAAPEKLVEIRGVDAAALVRVAWHLGNRHLPTELLKKSLRIRRDHVIEDMARRLGASVAEIEAPFNPEGGAYVSAAPVHGHDHDDHDLGAHDHAHGRHGDSHHAHGDHQSVEAEPHVHGPNCGHDHHDHDHSHSHSHDDAHGAHGHAKS